MNITSQSTKKKLRVRDENKIENQKSSELFLRLKKTKLSVEKAEIYHRTDSNKK
jgi:hypothetical protein